MQCTFCVIHHEAKRAVGFERVLRVLPCGNDHDVVEEPLEKSDRRRVDPWRKMMLKEGQCFGCQQALYGVLIGRHGEGDPVQRRYWRVGQPPFHGAKLGAFEPGPIAIDQMAVEPGDDVWAAKVAFIGSSGPAARKFLRVHHTCAS
jgi:hypothetical protein